MFLLPVKERMEMGHNARKRAIDIFDEKIITGHYKEAIYALTQSL